MPRVDFYILPANSTQQRFACLMANKAWQQGHSIYLHVASRDQAAMMDDLLWTFRDISFLPHAMADDGQRDAVPVHIGWQEDHIGQQDVFINLSPSIPTAVERFARIVEIVSGNEPERNQARQRYRDYRERGYELHNHTIDTDNEHA